MNDQPLFDFFKSRGDQKRDTVQAGNVAGSAGREIGGAEPEAAVELGRGSVRSRGRDTDSRAKAALRRAVMRWLEATRRPLGMMVSVPTRQSRYRADVAAFWSSPVSNVRGRGPGRLLVPSETLVVECYSKRQECWVDCARAEQILPLLKDARRRRLELEGRIRADEPELRRPDALFEEMAEWEYDRTRNPEYRRLVAEIADLEAALHSGTKFEQIRKAEVADLIYAAVPAGLVAAAEVADGWGLLWVHPDLAVTVEKEAVVNPVPAANRAHLVQNIAAAAKARALATEGVSSGGRQGVTFVKAPRLHRKPQTVYHEFDIA